MIFTSLIPKGNVCTCINNSKSECGWQNEKANSNWCSQAVTHPSTNQAQRCLTSLIRREAVHSTRYVTNTVPYKYKLAPSCCHTPSLNLLNFKNEKNCLSTYDSPQFLLCCSASSMLMKTVGKPCLTICSRWTTFFPRLTCLTSG